MSTPVPAVPYEVLRKLANAGLALLGAQDAVIRQRSTVQQPETAAEKAERLAAGKLRNACIEALNLGRAKSQQPTLLDDSG